MTAEELFKVLESLCKKYPNDQELGLKIRKLVTKNNEE